jgi:uncharacterized protein
MPSWMLLLTVGCAQGETGNDLPSQPTLATIPLQVGATAVIAEVADDEKERELGLMGRTSLGANQGMLFIYPDEAPRSFWMKNTVLPLSIAYLDSQGRIVRIADMTPLDLSPVPSRRPAMYALEMEQGWFAAHGVHEGDKVEGLATASSK